MLIDIHTHVNSPATVTRPDGTTFCTPQQLIAKLDEAGIDMAVLLPLVSPEHRCRCVMPEEMLDITAQYPDRFIPFCNLDPRMVSNTMTADFMPLLEWYKNAGCKGVGEITANMPFDNPMVWNMLGQCEKAEMPVIFHVGPRVGGCYGLIDDLGLPRLERTLAQFPDLKLLGHSQPFWAEISADVTEGTRNGYPKGKVTPGRVVELMRKYPNLYGDMSAGSGHNAVSRDPEFGYAFMEEFQDRLLFGTDICAPHNATPLVGFLREARISSEAREKIGWRNANRVLGLGLE